MNNDQLRALIAAILLAGRWNDSANEAIKDAGEIMQIAKDLNAIARRYEDGPATAEDQG